VSTKSFYVVPKGLLHISKIANSLRQLRLKTIQSN